MKKIFTAVLLLSIIFIGCNSDSIVQPEPVKMDPTKTDILCPSPDIKYLAPANGSIIRSGFANVSYAVDNLTINHYRVQSYIDGVEQSAYSIDIEDASSGQFSVAYSKGLPYGKHTISVRATNHGLLGSVTNSGKDHVVYMRPNYPPSTPTLSYTYNSDNGIVALNCSDVTNGIPGMIDGYKVYRSIDGGPWHISSLGGLDQYSATAEHPAIEALGTVSFKVKAYDQHLESGFSNVITYNYGDYYRDEDRDRY